MTYNLAWRDNPHVFKVDQAGTPGLPCQLCGLTKNSPVHVAPRFLVPGEAA